MAAGRWGFMFVTGYLSPTVGDSKLLLHHLTLSPHRFAVNAGGNIFRCHHIFFHLDPTFVIAGTAPIPSNDKWRMYYGKYKMKMPQKSVCQFILFIILLLLGINTDKSPSASAIFESDDAGDTRVKRIVAADADICAWFEF